MQIVNWKMATHPMNYLVILVMLLIVGAIGHSVLTLLGVEPATASTNPPTAGLSTNLDPSQPTV